MRILVTGGAGYVGSLLVPQLLLLGHQVVVLDWFIFRSIKDIQAHPGLTLIKADIRDTEITNSVMAGIDVVIHLAAIPNDPSGDINRNLTKAINHLATCTLVDAAAAAKVKRFINTSSASVYGVSYEMRVVETLQLNPQTAYAEAKATSEAYVLSLNTSSFTTVSVRPATLHGYAERLRLDLITNIFVFQAITQRRIHVSGGTQYRPSLSILDMVRFYVELLEAPANVIGGKTFNITESNHTVREIAEIVRLAVDPTVNIMLCHSKDTRSYRLCADRAKKYLGFQPLHTISESAKQLATVLRSWDHARIGEAHYRNVGWLKRL